MHHDRSNPVEIYNTVWTIAQIHGIDTLIDIFNCLPVGDIGDAARYYAINARGLMTDSRRLRTEKPRKPVFEFRQHHGSTDWYEIRNWIYFCASIVELCNDTTESDFVGMINRALFGEMSLWEWLEWIGEPRIMPFYIKKSIRQRQRWGLLPKWDQTEDQTAREGSSSTKSGSTDPKAWSESYLEDLIKDLVVEKTQDIRQPPGNNRWRDLPEDQWPFKAKEISGRYSARDTGIILSELQKQEAGRPLGGIIPRIWEINSLDEHRRETWGQDQEMSDE